MQNKFQFPVRAVVRRAIQGAGAWLAVAALFAGCTHSHLAEDRRSAAERLLAAQPPTFLTGPMSVLLTNSASYSARVQIDTTSPLTTVQGTLLGSHDKLVFARDPGKATKKSTAGGGFSFIWDVPDNSGTVISEALQGYAPADGGVRYTSVLTQPDSVNSTPSSDSIDGHPCRREQASVTASDGSIVVFRVWRATDLKGLPLRIESMSAPGSYTITFSKVRLEQLSADLFNLGDGYKRYSNPDTMLNEITVRQQNVRKKEPETPDVSPETPGTQGRFGVGQ